MNLVKSFKVLFIGVLILCIDFIINSFLFKYSTKSNASYAFAYLWLFKTGIFIITLIILLFIDFYRFTKNKISKLVIFISSISLILIIIIIVFGVDIGKI